LEAARQGDPQILQIAQVRLLHELPAHPVVIAGRGTAPGANLHGVGPNTQHHRVAKTKRAAFISAEVELAATDETRCHEVSR